MWEKTVPIERDDHVLRTRKTAAATRIVLGFVGIALIAAQPSLQPHAWLGIAGFASIVLTSVVQLASTRVSWLRVEESLAGIAAILIVGLGDQRVTILSVLWLVAVATGVMARGGRVHWIGRTVVLAALALPILRMGEIDGQYAAFCFAVIGLQLTSGRLTRELNRLLRQARLEAESAETLLLAGDIAARMSIDGAPARPPEPEPPRPLDPEETANAHRALAKLIAGEGLAMAMQPIVDIGRNEVHAYEALARFERRRSDRSPLHWFALAEELGERAELERACLRAALELFPRRPEGARMSVNLSIPTLLDDATQAMLWELGRSREDDLDGLIIEITEETLVDNSLDFGATIAALRRRGAMLAVDDVGAGYSGLRQITAVTPDYLKLDRSLICGIDRDDDRAALVSALVGYGSQVGSLIVAEGIEELRELERLRELKVPLVQGFYLGLPGKPWPQITPEGEAALTPTMAAAWRAARTLSKA
ncbi:MAG TPA: EAL domain-containing protein [Solirubrobacterales bacterium]|jgi:EAL domain-containing protein (putative c-di-GMP-specific phosphodiesterase class I)|nr:EAL domain-containing protein [Solirubrobacterales bacterium]